MSALELETALLKLTPDERKDIIQRVDSHIETLELRNRLPVYLQPFAGAISVRRPMVKHDVEASRAANGGEIKYHGDDVFMCVGPNFQTLDGGCSKWRGDNICYTGGEGYSKAHVWLEYGGVQAEAGVTEFGDPGRDMYAHWSVRVKDVVKKVVGDMGFEGDLSGDQCLEVLEAFMGTRGIHVLDEIVREGEPKLRDVIKDDLKKEKWD